MRIIILEKQVKKEQVKMREMDKRIKALIDAIQAMRKKTTMTVKHLHNNLKELKGISLSWTVKF